MRPMSRQNKTSTMGVLIIGLIVIFMIMASTEARTSAVARLQRATATPTTCPPDEQDICDEDATDAAIDYSDTQTAIASTGTATGTITVTGTAGTATGTPGTSTPTATRTAILSPTGTGGLATPTPTLSSSVPTVGQQPIEPTATLPQAPEDALTCFPGDPVLITGDGPPRAAFLLYFGDRVVSGGSVAPNGRFATRLVVGNERGGIYSVSVRVRGTSNVLREITCSVPDVTPTPLPRARDLP
jgi:hypothetical protein